MERLLIGDILLNMKKYKIENLFIRRLRRTRKGFTLIELLMVVAIIAILSTMVLITLDSGREKAELNRYFSYGTQMYRLAAGSAAAGQFDSHKTGLSPGDTVCLSKTCGNAGTGLDDPAGENMKKALTYLTKMPETTEENSQSPYNSDEGVTITYKPGTTALNVVRITMYVVGGHGDFVHAKCNSIGWATSHDETSCYQDVKLSTRL